MQVKTLYQVNGIINMNLPSLPIKKNKREQKFTTIFKRWLETHPMQSSVFELKQTTGYSIPFAAVKEHQINALAQASNSYLIYKIPDDSRGPKPCDIAYFNTAGAYIVVKFPEWFVGISIGIFHKEMVNSKRRSLTQKRALEICSFRQGC